MQENEQYRQLFQLLQARPEVEALEIFRRIREGDEPLVLIDTIKQANVLLPSPTLIKNDRNQRLDRLDCQALHDSIINVPAQPWTTVVGDGLMSELITHFFTWNGTYLCPILDQDIFLEEMKSGYVENARCCTPLLVNAICAMESVGLPLWPSFDVD